VSLQGRSIAISLQCHRPPKTVCSMLNLVTFHARFYLQGTRSMPTALPNSYPPNSNIPNRPTNGNAGNSNTEQASNSIVQVVRSRAWAFVLLYAAVSLVLRFAPLPENFATFGALAYFCGMMLTGPARWIVPAVALFAADCIGHFLNIPGMGFYHLPSMLLNYAGMAAFGMVGVVTSWIWKRQKVTSQLALATLPASVIAGSALFFLVSNFGAWLDPRMGYDTTLSGLMNCYWMGLPFWRSSLSSDLVFGTGFVMFAWAISSRLATRIQTR